MPHINRVRLVNVAFNNANSYFDDLRLNMASKSTTYDLENGGGKSVLLMMMLQTVIPNVSLREDKPLKNIFIGGKDRTSHVLIEWTLDEGERYKYMLTGFCARKKRSHTENQQPQVPFEQDDDITSEGVDYYNYVIFYQKPEEYDIYSLELVKEDISGKTYIGYDELRSELSRLRQRGVPINIFSRKGEYMEYIGLHNLLSTEWKIIREINSGENSIEKYFRENKTSRRLIENLLLKIIDDTEGIRKSSSLKDEGNMQLAKTLIEIRENLTKLMKDKEHLEEYNQIQHFYDRMLTICNKMKEDFNKGEQLKENAVKVKNLLSDMLDKMQADKTLLEGQKSEAENNNKKTVYEKKLLDIQLLEFDKRVLLLEQEEIKAEQDDLIAERENQDNAYREAGARKEYIQYKNAKQEMQKQIKALDAMSMNRDELTISYNKVGSLYKLLLDNLLAGIKAEIEDISRRIGEHTECENEIDSKLEDINRKIGAANTVKDNIDNQIEDLNKAIRVFTDYFNEKGRLDIILNQSSFLADAEKELMGLQESLLKIDKSISKIKDNMQKSSDDITYNKHQAELLNRDAKLPERFFKEYKQASIRFKQLLNLYDSANGDELKHRLLELLSSNNEMLFRKKVEMGVKERRLEALKTYGFYIPNEEILALADKLRGKCVFTQAGIEWITSLDEAEREHWLDRIPLLHYGVLIDHDSFMKIKTGRLDFGGFISDYPVPIIDVDILRGQDELKLDEVIFPTTNKSLIISKEALDKYETELVNGLEQIKTEIASIEDKSITYNQDLQYLMEFNKIYSEDKVIEQQDLLKGIQDRIAEYEGLVKSLDKQIIEYNKEEQNLNLRKANMGIEIEVLQEQMSKATQLLDLNDDLSDANKSLQSAKRELNELEQQSKSLNQDKLSIKNKKSELNDRRSGLNGELIRYEAELLRTAGFSINDIDHNKIDPRDMSIESVKSDFDALDEQLKGRNQEELNIRNQISAHKNMMKKCADDMEEHYGYTVTMFEQREITGELLTEPDDIHIRALKSNVEKLDGEIKNYQTKFDKLNMEISHLNGSIETERASLDDDLHIDLAKYNYRNEIEEDIKKAEQIIELYEKELKELEKDYKSLNEKINVTKYELEHYEDFINRENIQYHTSELTDEMEDYQHFSDNYYNHMNGMKQWEQSWKRTIKSILSESQGFFIKDPVTELANLEVPITLASCIMLIGQLEKSIEIIHEKINMIQDDIAILQSYQEEFVIRCIQRADSVLDILKKLPALSRIDIGVKTNMIKMEFADFDDNEKQLRMENHIRSIIKEISDEGVIDKNQIAKRLDTKELLAQVTNMEKAVVRLYKVENIREHSRYLRWENAVGSEGQSNALYFIFAVCLISYIRMLSSRNISVKTKKVIIADNPFGATSAVYLWDPMFKILESNGVQLIAPGHNIPKELTSMFEVNYLLNQDILADSRIKVVVKDVRTEEDLDQMNYGKLEQMTLF